jgi:uncharacterized RDD family membrane protein YckC
MHDTRLPRAAYTAWRIRSVAALFDVIPVGLGWGVWELVAVTSVAIDCVTYPNGGVVCTSTRSPESVVVAALMVVVTVGYLGWNFGYRQGATGSSIGKSVMRFQVVDGRTWRPIGFTASVLRQFVHLVDAVVCFVGFLVPLWDARRQTLADKLMNTVCVPRTPPPLNEMR